MADYYLVSAAQGPQGIQGIQGPPGEGEVRNSSVVTINTATQLIHTQKIIAQMALRGQL